MEIYGPSGANRSTQISVRKLADKLKAAGILSSEEADEVEISDLGRFLSYLSQLPQVRSDRVEALRRQIEDGSYDVDSKIDEIIDSLLEDIGMRRAV